MQGESGFTNVLFAFLFLFRYLRVVVHLVAFLLYKPLTLTKHSNFYSYEASVIVPTVDPTNKDFEECLRSILAASPAAVFIVTAGGSKNFVQAQDFCRRIQKQYPRIDIEVIPSKVANKRLQVSHAIPYVTTEFTVLADDHVFWPFDFLQHCLLPFADPRVGIVGTNKRVRREHTGFTISSFFNMLGCLYLERHSHEVCATNSIDGGVFAISGRTSVHRTCILQQRSFLKAFTDERFFFGLFGPLNADDDNFITRWNVTHGWKIRIQHSEETMIETTLGEYPRFLQQCLRWARTTFRSNAASLFTDRTVWRTQLWSIYAVYTTSFFNYALFFDTTLVIMLKRSNLWSATALSCLLIFIFGSKLVKPFPHFMRNPKDIVFIPFYILFIWTHSFLKLYACLTFWETSWSGRTLEDTDDGFDVQLDIDAERPTKPPCTTEGLLPKHTSSNSLGQPLKFVQRSSWTQEQEK